MDTTVIITMFSGIGGLVLFVLLPKVITKIYSFYKKRVKDREIHKKAELNAEIKIKDLKLSARKNKVCIVCKREAYKDEPMGLKFSCVECFHKKFWDQIKKEKKITAETLELFESLIWINTQYMLWERIKNEIPIYKEKRHWVFRFLFWLEKREKIQARKKYWNNQKLELIKRYKQKHNKNTDKR